jgi:hypothetical protein
MVEMVDDQTSKPGSKSLKEGKKKSPVLEQNCSLSCSDASSLASRPVCVCLLRRFGSFLWQVASGWGPKGLWVEAFS